MTDDFDRSDEYRETWFEDDPDGAQLLDDVAEFLARFVVYPSEETLHAHVLWIAHAWLMDAWESTPRIAFLSPEPGSGKSRALEVTEPLVPRPIHAVNCTPAYLFRKVSDPEGLPSILYDECDTLFGPKAKDHEEIRGMLNAGHRKGAIAGRCVVRGKVVETEELPAYCAVALAGLDDLPDTIMSRAVVVRMRRRAPSEPVEPWRRRVNTPEAYKLRDRLAAWADLVRVDAREAWPEFPNGVQDRAADVWEPLLAVADLAGGDWPRTARVAAVTVVTDSMGATPTLGVLLLKDIRTVFDALDARNCVTDALLTNLKGIEESPWGVIRKGEPLDARALGQRLRKYDIQPKSIREGGKVFKGYTRAQFEDAWSRYLPPVAQEPPSETSVTSVTSFTSQVSGLPVTDTPAGVTATPADVTATCGVCGTELTTPASIRYGLCRECRITTGTDAQGDPGEGIAGW